MLKELELISRAIGKELWSFWKGLSGCEVMNGLDGKLEVRGGETCREAAVDNSREER